MVMQSYIVSDGTIIDTTDCQWVEIDCDPSEDFEEIESRIGDGEGEYFSVRRGAGTRFFKIPKVDWATAPKQPVPQSLNVHLRVDGDPTVGIKSILEKFLDGEVKDFTWVEIDSAEYEEQSALVTTVT